MHTPHWRLPPRLIAAALALGLAGTASATLGEQEETAARDATAMGTTSSRLAASVRGASAVHELRAGRLAVRQYAGADGTVFAVAWDGPIHPDLDTLLGVHARALRAAAAGPRTARGPRRIVAGNLVVEFGGHGRTLQGRAYLIDAVPAGASLDDLQ